MVGATVTAVCSSTSPEQQAHCGLVLLLLHNPQQSVLQTMVAGEKLAVHTALTAAALSDEPSSRGAQLLCKLGMHVGCRPSNRLMDVVVT